MVNAETDSGPHQTSRRYLTVKIISQNSQHQEFDGVLKFSDFDLHIIKPYKSRMNRYS